MTNDLNGGGAIRGARSEAAGRRSRAQSRAGSSPAVHSDRLPPHDPEMERGLLGCCLLDPAGALGDVIEALPAVEVFYDLRHQAVYRELQAMARERVPVDLLTLKARLEGQGLLEQVGGLTELMALSDAAPSAANWSYYAEVVREKWLVRKMIQACVETVAEAWDVKVGATQDWLAQAEQRFQSASEVRVPATERSMAQVMDDVRENVLEQYRRGVKFRIGPMTGFNYLDNILPGLGKGQMIVVAARPRTGKSALIMQVAEHVALVEQEPVAVFSLEMTARSLGLREIFQRGGCDLTMFLNGFLVNEDVRKLVLAGVDLAKAPITIDESPRMSIEDLEVRARRLVRKRGVKLIIVDYFQLLYARNARPQWSKSDELAYISMRVKALAKELELPIVLCAQMNRQIEQDANRRPRLADLKDTGQLEQDADVIMFLWKPQVNLENDKHRARVEGILKRVPVPDDWRTMEKNEEGKNWRHYLSLVNCTVEKQREGRSGEDALLVFIRPWTRFVDAYRPEHRKETEDAKEGEGE